MGKRTFKVLRPVGISGRRERGELIKLTLEEAQNIGSDYLQAVDPEVVLTSTTPMIAKRTKSTDTIPSTYKVPEPEPES